MARSDSSNEEAVLTTTPAVRPGDFSKRTWSRGSGAASVVRAPLGRWPGRRNARLGPGWSGKTVLLRSWIVDAGLSDRVAWVSVGRVAATQHGLLMWR